jgi:DtxR family Mn-dependent transcriptional regulator
VKVLHFDWSEVHVEAEELEHSISNRLLERIDALLGRPTYDPHGDPIPSAEGEVLNQEVQQLSAAPASTTGTVARIADQDSHFLRYATERGLVPGASVTIDSVDVAGDAITISVNGAQVTMGKNAAAKILIASQH